MTRQHKIYDTPPAPDYTRRDARIRVRCPSAGCRAIVATWRNTTVWPYCDACLDAGVLQRELFCVANAWSGCQIRVHDSAWCDACFSFASPEVRALVARGQVVAAKALILSVATGHRARRNLRRRRSTE